MDQHNILREISSQITIFFNPRYFADLGNPRYFSLDDKHAPEWNSLQHQVVSAFLAAVYSENMLTSGKMMNESIMMP
uniref:Uncharacterized protein n=1 Tax=Oryza rufipogon TaxID=4529 RepID=A0A0E0MXU2_ORYRU